MRAPLSACGGYHYHYITETSCRHRVYARKINTQPLQWKNKARRYRQHLRINTRGKMVSMSPTMAALVAFFALAFVIGSVSAACEKFEVHKATEHKNINGKYKKEKDIQECNGKWVYVSDDDDTDTFLYYVKIDETTNGWAVGKKNCNADAANQLVLGTGTGNIAYPNEIDRDDWKERKGGKWVDTGVYIGCKGGCAALSSGILTLLLLVLSLWAC